MPEGGVLTAITAIVSTLAAVIAVLWRKSEARWEKAFEDQRLARLEAINAVVLSKDMTIELMAKQYETQLATAKDDIRDYKRMLGLSIQSGKTAVEVGVEQARRLGSGDR